MQDGMQQYEKELQMQKSRDIIPPFDTEKFHNRDIHIEDNSPQKDTLQFGFLSAMFVIKVASIVLSMTSTL